MQTAERFTHRQTQLSAAKQALLKKRLEGLVTPVSAADTPVIGPRPTAETIPLSFAQQRLWFLQQLEPESAAYNEVMFAHIYGPFHAQAFVQTFGEIVRRHQVLCCYFPLQDGQVVQIIDKQIIEHFDIFCYDMRDVPLEQREGAMVHWAQQQMLRPFDLKNELPWRTFLVQLDEQEYVSLTIMHHIVTDGWSWSIFHREFRELYAAFSQQQDSPLPELTVQYGDYAHWQREWVESEAAQQQLHYWQQQLAEPLPLLDLPTDRQLGDDASSQGGRVTIEIAAGLAQEVQAFGKQVGVTPFMTLLAGLLILLYRYTQQEDLLIGTPIAGRTQPEVEQLFGCFLNTLVLRTKLDGELTVQELVQRVREGTLAAYDHQEYPFEKLVELLQPERDLGRNPFFQVLFTLQNMPLVPFELRGLHWTPLKIETHTAKFALGLALQETAEGIVGHLEYQTALFEQGTIERMGRHYVQILREMVRQPQQLIGALALLQDHEQLLAGWNATEAAYPVEGRYTTYVHDQVQAQPHTLAVRDEQEHLSYQQLWQRATHLAAHLQALGIEPSHEVLVGVYLERSVHWAVAVLATLLVGGVYLPLDPAYPAGRLRYMREHAGCRCILTTREHAQTLAEVLGEAAAQVEILYIEELVQQAPAQAYQAVPSSEHQLAYVIYTSGSTGTPKGVMVEQCGMLNHLLAKVETLQLDAGDIVAQTASPCFDISLWQLLAAWLVGAAVRIYPTAVVMDPTTLLRVVHEEQISVLVVVPSLLRALLDEQERTDCERSTLAHLRWMISTGEALPAELCRRWLACYPQIPLVNAYGPTECSDNVSQHMLGKSPRASETRVPIGRALPNLHLYVLDARMQPQPVGVWGEMYVGGVGVGRGYLGDALRTAQAFVPDPWSREPGGRLYRTGDLGRYRANGVLEFGGRRDQQVKIRGYRIELGEIEQVICRCSQVRACVVAVSAEKSGSEQLVAYVVLEAGVDSEWEHALSTVRQELPEYMVPSVVVVLEALPLTTSGKVDRHALPALADAGRRIGYMGPRTPTEEQLVAIWREVLALEQVGVDDNFFAIGGHSLQITRVLARMRNLFQVTISLRTMFKNPTVAALAEIIQDEQRKIQGIEDMQIMGNELRKQGLIPIARDAYRHKRSEVINELHTR